MSFTLSSLINSPSYRISYFDYILGEFFPTTHVICVIELDGSTVWWHEWSHRMLTCYSPVHDLALELYFDKLAGNDFKADRLTSQIEQYRELMEGHASAMVKLADEFRDEEQALKNTLEKKTGHILRESQFGNQIALDLERISKSINPEAPIDACESLSNALGESLAKDDAPAYKEALSWIKGNWYMFRGLRSLELTRKLAMELDRQGFTTTPFFYGFHVSHIRILIAILHYLNFLRLVLEHKNTEVLVPVLIPLVTSALGDWGPSITIFFSGNRGVKPTTAACRFPLEEYKPPQIEGKCLMSQQSADLIAKCSALKQKNMLGMEKLKAYLYYFWEALAQVEIGLLNVPDCEQCRLVKEEIQREQGKVRMDLEERPISKSETTFHDAIELYEPWLENYGLETANDFRHLGRL